MKIALAAILLVGLGLMWPGIPDLFPKTGVDFRQRVLKNEASPLAWMDLGKEYLRQGDLEHSRYCLSRAVTLGPNIPPVLLQMALYYFVTDAPREALTYTARIQALLPDYDRLLFEYYDQFIPDAGAVLGALGGDRKASVRYFRHLLDPLQKANAELAWGRLSANHVADEGLAAEYVASLVRGRFFERAQAVWIGFEGARKCGNYPRGNGLFNGSFEYEPSGGDFDWRFQPSDAFELARDCSTAKTGKCSARIGFAGQSNVEFSNITQMAVVRAATYAFTGYLKTDSVTTDEGVGFRITDAENGARLDVKTEKLTGTHEWTAIRQIVAIPAGTRVLRVTTFRDLSLKFDNKIGGSAWVDDLELRPIG